MMKFRENEDAVSPVIGVILMVAITVILAAVIAAFVFGMAGNIQSTKSVAATVTQQGQDKIIITYQGGPDAADVAYLRVTAPNTTVYNTTDAKGELKKIDETNAAGKPPTVGASMTLTLDPNDDVDKDWSDRDHVVVTAHFKDGSDQVILDTFV